MITLLPAVPWFLVRCPGPRSMTPELGQLALILALLLALTQSILPLIGAWRGNHALMAVARPAAAGQAVFVAMAFGILAWAFISFDFSVHYVATNSNLALPWYYRFAAVWGAHEGSLLLWILILNVWTRGAGRVQPEAARGFAARVLGVMGLDQRSASSPSPSSPPIRSGGCCRCRGDGADLNPVLQDPGMTIHPPMLYMGYVGFSVAFAFSIAALLGGELEQAWVRWARPWTNVAWAFLTWASRRQLVGVRRARLGRLVVLGSGGERQLHAVAGRHGADPCAGGDREARLLRAGRCCCRSSRSR